MSDLVTELAAIQKELKALKAGFTGNETRFEQTTLTSQVFTITAERPLLIKVSFEFRDWPMLFTVDNNNPGPDYANGFERKDFYEWRYPVDQPLGPVNYSFTATLLSIKPPLTFTIEQEP